MALNKELVEILACPKCKGDLVLLPEENGLECRHCEVVYPIREEIPIMLVDEAVQAVDWKNEERQG